jgi:hypothetical protein
MNEYYQKQRCIICDGLIPDNGRRRYLCDGVDCKWRYYYHYSIIKQIRKVSMNPKKWVDDISTFLS